MALGDDLLAMRRPVKMPLTPDLLRTLPATTSSVFDVQNVARQQRMEGTAGGVSLRAAAIGPKDLRPESVTFAGQLETPPDDAITPAGTPAPSEIGALGKALSTFGKTVSQPGFQKLLAALGMAISPSKNDPIGEFAIEQAESNARAMLREQLTKKGEAGAGARVSGLSSEGREREIAMFRQGEQQRAESVLAARREGREESAEQRAVRAEDRQERVAESLIADREETRRAENLRDLAAMDQQEFTNTLNMAKLKLDERATQADIAVSQSIVELNKARSSAERTGDNTVAIRQGELAARLSTQFAEEVKATRELASDVRRSAVLTSDENRKQAYLEQADDLDAKADRLQPNLDRINNVIFGAIGLAGDQWAGPVRERTLKDGTKVLVRPRRSATGTVEWVQQ